MSMKKQERKERFALTLLYTALVFVHILLTVVVVGLALYLLIRFGVLSGSDEAQLSSTSIILIFGLASLLVGTVLTFFISKLLLRPINTIINRINHLAAGDYKVRLQPGRFIMRHSTVREFTHSFNRMARELESTEMLRSDFINNFSHEFKTPIVSIAGFVKLLQTGALSEQQEQEYLAIIEEESLRLSQMATNVLELTKVENQTVLTNVARYDLSEQIRAAILLLAPKWEPMDLEFSLEFPEVYLEGSEDLLKQVWINLLDNAVKFSSPGGVITVDITEQKDAVAVSVTNNGPVIPPDKQKKIFNKFYQADESHSTAGNGVGLAVVKRVVELHRGRVAVKSEFGATTFTVTLPSGQA